MCRLEGAGACGQKRTWHVVSGGRTSRKMQQNKSVLMSGRCVSPIDDMDLVTIGITEIGSKIAITILRAGTRGTFIGPALPQGIAMGQFDGAG